MMIPFKGRLSIKQYIPKKPKPWGESRILWRHVQELKSQGICGTGNRLQGAQLILKSEKHLKKEGRGACSVVTNAQNLSITRWLDSHSSISIWVGSGTRWPQLTEAEHANRCQGAACTRRTKYICMQGRVASCPGCFANYHGR
ncbi:hypothetical protein KUCAC02_035183 [Chaenocephalus aceratus]|nr:hypothetical protein KUCAC02_035183 [Chaenocephalus aceratus]